MVAKIYLCVTFLSIIGVHESKSEVSGSSKEMTKTSSAKCSDTEQTFVLGQRKTSKNKHRRGSIDGANEMKFSLLG